MTLSIDDLEDLFDEASRRHPGIHKRGKRAGIRAVIEALRDEICNGYAENSARDLANTFNEILAPRGDEAAGAVAQAVEPLEIREVTGASPVCPAAAPDAAVCEWTLDGWTPDVAWYKRACNGNIYERDQRHFACPSCSLPIKFVEAAR